MEFEKVLLNYKKALIIVLTEADVNFVERLAAHRVISANECHDLCTLDYDNTDSRLRGRYFQQVICRGVHNLTVFVQFVDVLAQFDFSGNLDLLLKIEVSKKSTTVHSGTDSILIGRHCYKWETIGIALGLSKSIIEDCRSGTTNAAKLHNTLVSWQQNNMDANLKVIKHALRKSIVGMASLADRLEGFIQDFVLGERYGRW